MAAITTEPDSKIVVNAPYDQPHTYQIKITNSGGRRIGWAIRSTNAQRFDLDPASGVLAPRQNVVVAFTCNSFDSFTEDMTDDHVTVEWLNTPDDTTNEFRYDWLQLDARDIRGRRLNPIGRKNLNIE